MAGDATGTKMLDQLLAEQRAGTYVDPLVSAKKALIDSNRVRANESLNRNQSVGSLEPVSALKSMYLQAKDYLRPTTDFLGKAAEIPAAIAAFSGGVPAALAAGYYGVQAADNMAQDPSATNAAMLGLSALPATGSLRGEVSAAAEAMNAMKSASAPGQRWLPMARGVATDISHNDMPMVGGLDDALASSRFVNQTPEMLPATSETVAAPGFSLGPVTPIDQVPTSKAALAAMKKATKKASASTSRSAEGTVAGFTDLTPEDIAAAEANGYTYGQGLPATVRRRTGR